MKRILWLSRHDPLPSQIERLKKIFGDVVVIKDSKPFSGAEDIANRFRNGKYDDLVAVAPLSVIAKLIEMGIKPIWAEMELVNPEEAEVEANGRYYRFKKFRRINRIIFDFEDLE